MIIQVHDAVDLFEINYRLIYLTVEYLELRKCTVALPIKKTRNIEAAAVRCKLFRRSRSCEPPS